VHSQTKPQPAPVSRPSPGVSPAVGVAAATAPATGTKSPRDKCFEQNPFAVACDFTEMDRDEVVVDFLLRNGLQPEDLQDCTGFESHGPGVIDACDGAPGESWHCNVRGNRVVSVFACLCCGEDGKSSFVWRGPHWSVFLGRRGGK
jgi:hypothetical protein